MSISSRPIQENSSFVYLEQEQVQIMIEQFHDKGWNVDELIHPFGRGVNSQIELTNIQPIIEWIKRAKITFYRELDESWYDTDSTLSGQQEFLVKDPDGYLLRFTQYLGEKAKS